MSDIMSISRLRLGTDGKGITTLVAFHGCPLNCKFCINRQCHNAECVRANFTVDELIDILLIDEPYYLMTGGGVTFGGGEPLLQADFIHEVCQKMNKKWNRTIETSLYTKWDNIEKIVDDIDYWYIDIKDTNEAIYMEYTSKSNEYVLQNLKKLVALAGVEKVCVRLPLIPSYNTEKDIDKSILYIFNEINPNLMINVFEYIRC